MEKICSICGKIFEQNQNLKITRMGIALGRNPENERCYSCALDFLTGGCVPEEGDFNSAHLISGEMSEQEWQWFQEDLQDQLRRYPEEDDGSYQWWENGIEYRSWNGVKSEYKSAETDWRWKPWKA